MVLAVLHPSTLRRKGFLRLSFAAIGLYTAATCWSAEQLSDGVVSRDELYAAVPQFSVQGADLDAAIAELVAIGEFQVLDEAGSYRISDFLEWNTSKSEVLAKRAAERERYRERQAGRHRARTRNDRRPRSGVSDQRIPSVAPSITSAGAYPRMPATSTANGPNGSLPADCQQSGSAPPVPPLPDPSLTSRSELRDHPNQTPSGLAGGEGHHHLDLDLGREEKPVEADPQIHAEPMPDKRTLVGRLDYAPSSELWAEWHERATPEQWLASLDRYHRTGMGDVLLYKIHEKRFVEFLKSTLRFAGMHAKEKQARLDRRDRSREPEQTTTTASLKPTVTKDQSELPPLPNRPKSFYEMTRNGGKAVYDTPEDLAIIERFRAAKAAEEQRRAEAAAAYAKEPKPWVVAMQMHAERLERQAKKKEAANADA